MTLVKGSDLPPFPEHATPHVAALGARMLDLVRQALMQEQRDGLRPSHFRVLSTVPPEGATITELAPQLAMTAQAVSQFTSQLEATGHVSVKADPADGRRRVVRRSPLGDATVAAVEERIAALEASWAQRVGPDRYRTFREVLAEISAFVVEPDRGGR